MDCCLNKGELIRLDGGNGGLQLRCKTGTVWLTSGNGADYLVRTGKRFEIPAHRVAILEALEPTEFCLGELQAANAILSRPIIGFAAC